MSALGFEASTVRSLGLKGLGWGYEPLALGLQDRVQSTREEFKGHATRGMATVVLLQQFSLSRSTHLSRQGPREGPSLRGLGFRVEQLGGHPGMRCSVFKPKGETELTWYNSPPPRQSSIESTNIKKSSVSCGSDSVSSLGSIASAEHHTA